MLWVVLVTACTVLGVVLVGETYSAHRARPTITAIESSRHALWKFPFPAVTVCGVNQLQRADAAALVDRLNLPEGTLRTDVFKDIRLLTDFFELEVIDDELSSRLIRLQKIFDSNNLTVRAAMEQMAPNCTQMINRCLWKGRVLRKCSSMFQDLETFEGFCCIFNYRGLSEDTLRGSQQDMADKRVAGCGPNTGLTVILNNDMHQYLDTMLASHGFQVMIHSSLDYPDANAQQLLVSPGFQTLIAVSPTETYPADGVRDIAVERRHCRFDDESNIPVMRNYSYSNCIMDCRRNMSLQLCGCYGFYFPAAEDNKVCNLTDLPCLSKHKEMLWTLQGADTSSNFHSLPLPCGCLPECLMVSYDVQTTHSPFQPEARENVGTKFYNELDPDNHTVFHVFFTDLVGTRYRMSPYLGWLDLLASVGGILSLMVGFSLVSGVELIYFFTLRPLCTSLQRRGWGGRRVRVGSPPPPPPRDDSAFVVRRVDPYANSTSDTHMRNTRYARDFCRPPAGYDRAPVNVWT